MTDVNTLKLLSPEIVLIAFGTLIYLAGAFFPRRFSPLALALMGVAVAGAALFATREISAGIFASPPDAWASGPLRVDLFGHTARWGILIAGALVLLAAQRPAADPQAPEYTGSLLLILAGLMLSAAGDEMVLLFLGLELVSIPTYVLLYVGKRGAAAQEATAKYFFLSILASAFFLYGLSFLYGVGGSTSLSRLAEAMGEGASPNGVLNPLAALGLVLLFAGMGFRLTAVPFHFYAPDVYQGTSHANAGLLSTLPKAAGLLVLVRIVVGSMPGAESLGWKIALALSVLTMTLGNVVALWQNQLRRLLAYSSIAHGGYLLIGLAVGLAQQSAASGGTDALLGVNGVGSALFYLAVYVIATMGTFAALAALESSGRRAESVADLSGLGQSRPLPAAALALFMFSLAGIPPLAGFWGKFALFSGAVDAAAPTTEPANLVTKWFFALSIIAVLNAATAAAYYLRIVKVMYFDSPPANIPAYAAPVSHPPFGPRAAMALCAVLVVVAGLVPGPVMSAADAAGAAAAREQQKPSNEAKVNPLDHHKQLNEQKQLAKTAVDRPLAR